MSAAIKTWPSDSRDHWLNLEVVQASRDVVSKADVLLLPEIGMRQDVPFAFHRDTVGFLHYLREHLGDEISVEVCADDERYLEISLHSDSHRLGKILVNYLVAPLIVGLLTNYVYDELKAKPDDKVEASILIEDSQCKVLSFSFDGNASEFRGLAEEAVKFSEICKKDPVKTEAKNDAAK